MSFPYQISKVLTLYLPGPRQTLIAHPQTTRLTQAMYEHKHDITPLTLRLRLDLYER